uniref:Uncharacterized protein n=1 Tax=Rhizophora mucronata TaxID=61149 RepID=A0A2P2MPF5_RHIMU
MIVETILEGQGNMETVDSKNHSYGVYEDTKLFRGEGLVGCNVLFPSTRRGNFQANVENFDSGKDLNGIFSLWHRSSCKGGSDCKG